MKIEIVSDVVCPWCVVGYKQLELALAQCNIEAEIYWQPFELNPNMPAEGQDLQEHIVEKYGITKEQSGENRDRLVAVGEPLGIMFNFSSDSRMVNTFKAHQLLHWAGTQSHQKEHQLKLALFQAYFTDQLDLNDDDALLALVENASLDKDAAIEVLNNETYSTPVRERQKTWTDRGISGVPAMVFCEKYLITGAQGVDNYVAILNQITDELPIA